MSDSSKLTGVSFTCRACGHEFIAQWKNVRMERREIVGESFCKRYTVLHTRCPACGMDASHTDNALARQIRESLGW